MNASDHLISNQARAISPERALLPVEPGASVTAIDLGPNARPAGPLQVLYIISEDDFPEELEAIEENFSRHQLNAGVLELGDVEGANVFEKRRDLETKIAQLHKDGRLDDNTVVIISMHGGDGMEIHDQMTSPAKENNEGENTSKSSAVKADPYKLSVMDGALEVDFHWLISRIRNTLTEGISYKGQIHLTACGAKRCMDLVAGDGYSYVAYGGGKSVAIKDAQITCLAVIDLLGHCHRQRIEFPAPEKIAEHAASVSGATVSVKTPDQSISFSAIKSVPHPLIVNETVKDTMASKGARVLEEKLAHGSAEVVEKTIEKFGEQIWTHLSGQVIFEVLESNRDVIKKLNFLEDQRWLLDSVNQEGNSLLHIAAEMEDLAILDFCLDAGLAIDKKNKEGERPLHIAVSVGSVDVVKRLIEKGANPSLWVISKDEKYNLLHIAVGFGNNDVIAAILESPHLEVNAVTGDGQKSALHFVAELDNSRAIGLLAVKHADLNIRDKDGNTPLHLAIKSGSMKAARALLEVGADPSVANDEGLQPLILAAMKNNGHFLVNLLISYDARVNATNQYKDTALHFAARAGNLQSVKILVNAGAAPSMTNQSGLKPVELAKKFDHRAIVKFLSEFRPGSSLPNHRL